MKMRTARMRKEAMMNRPRFIIAIVAALCLVAALQGWSQRKVTPINTPATATQPINEFGNDTARINARMRATMVHYHDENGNVIYVDTITGREWRDSTAMKAKKPMQYPLWHAVSVGVDIWNPVMRAFGQHFGLIDFSAQLSIHNRYKPVFETGLGLANNTPADNNFTYKSPLSIYFRVGMDYNFLYNSSPDYQFLGGLRFGFSPFSYSIEDITISSTYWDLDAHPTIPGQHATVLWWEVAFGLRVKLWGPISAGWTFRFHSIMHDYKGEYGRPWYIPGYGSRGGAINGSFTIAYTIPLNKKQPPKVNLSEDNSTLYFPEDTGQPNPEQIYQGKDAQNPE
ncbi:MAG: DUF6048 family protein [Bacteroidales bacterium]|nr:DUF6048 family protein [Bacteroidales bacterium]